MEKILCNLCGSDNTTQIYQTEKFNAVLCNVCALGYLNPRMTKEEYARHYEEDYQIARHNTNEYEKAVERLEKKGSYEQKKKHLAFLNHGLKDAKTVFEIGSGWGTLLKVVSDAYPVRAKGIEISNLAARVAKEYYHLDVEQTLLEDYLAQKKGEKFDFILMHHVFEHMLDPLHMLTEIRNLLNENGKLYLSLPNLAKPDEPLPKYFRVEHTFYFAPETLKAMLKKAGLEVMHELVGSNDMKFIVKKSDASAPSFEYAKLLKKRILLQLKINGFKERMKEKLKRLLRRGV